MFSGSVYVPSQDSNALMQSTPLARNHKAQPKKTAGSALRTAFEDTSSSEESLDDGDEDDVDLEDYSNLFKLAEGSRVDIASRYEGRHDDDVIRVAPAMPSSVPSLNATGMLPQRLTELDPTGL